MPGFLSMKNIVSKEFMMKFKIKFSIWISQNKVKTWIILELKLLFNSLEDLERNVQSSWSNQMIQTTEEKEDIWMINFDFISELTILIVESVPVFWRILNSLKSLLVLTLIFKIGFLSLPCVTFNYIFIN
jgi:hypothetical protein